MSETSLPTRHPSLRLLLLGYGHVAQAFLQLLASRSIWLGNEFGVRPVICGLGTKSHGLYIYPRGFEVSFLAQDADPFQQFIRNGTFVDNAEEFIEAGKTLRLVSQANLKQGVSVAEVRPRKLSKDDILLVGKGTTSVISIETEAMGTITLVEHEPTVTQTAYGVLSDLVTILKQKAS